MGWICARSFVGVAAMVLVSLISVDAASQLAPTGSHYGGRPSDGGHGSGSVDASGGFSTSVPLQVPAARDGVPVPLQLIHGAPGVGAAGLGWDVPLSYVRSTLSYARRRPQFTAWNPASTREEVMVVLGGRSMAFGEIAPGVWRAKRDAPGLQLIETGNGWAVIDLEGRVYLFPTRRSTCPDWGTGPTGRWSPRSIARRRTSSRPIGTGHC